MLKRPRVLLVEDQLDLRDLIGNALAEHGVDVVRAEDGRCAEELVKLHGDFDVVFSDVEMPNGVSGIELAQTVARHLPNAQIILASGYTRSQLPPLPEGVTFLSKPYRLKQLMALFTAVTRTDAGTSASGTDPFVSTPGQRMKESVDVFTALRNLLLPYRKRLLVVHDEDGHFYANCQHADAKGKDQFFGAVKVSGHKHVLHFMPVYDFPELLDNISPALKKRMQGKSCFNFDAYDPALLQELQALIEHGAARYEVAGKI